MPEIAVGTPAVLVVEDDPQMGALIERGLRTEGYEVKLAADGVAALIHVRQHPSRIAIVDLMLPGMSGFELCRRLRAADPDLRIIILTARDDVDDRVQGLDSGADDYLTKPFEFRELTARLRALQRRDAPPALSRLVLGDLTADALDRIVIVRDQRLHVSPKEFSVLWLLLRGDGAPVSRSTLLSEVWGTTEHTDPNIVDQYVSYLRKKLDRLQSGVRIVTERGVGFRLGTE